MSSKQKAIIIFLLFIFAALAFYFSPFGRNFFSSKKISLPGPLESKETRQAEEKDVLSDEEIIEITNEYRAEEGLGRLKESKKLSEAAMKRVEDMFKRQYFAHVAPDGSDVSDTLAVVEYEYAASGENLALGYFKNSKDLVDAWMASPGHRENILKKNFTEIGVAHKLDIYNGKKQYIAVQVFAKPLADCPMPDENLKKQITEKKNYIENLKDKIEVLGDEIDSLKEKINSLVEEINELYTESNELIKKGNQVYKKTKNKNSAEKYWSEGEEKRDLAEKKEEELKSLQSELEEKIDYYNNLISKIQGEQSLLEGLILKYNSQVENFNSCVKE